MHDHGPSPNGRGTREGRSDALRLPELLERVGCSVDRAQAFVASVAAARLGHVRVLGTVGQLLGGGSLRGGEGPATLRDGDELRLAELALSRVGTDSQAFVSAALGAAFPGTLEADRGVEALWVRKVVGTEEPFHVLGVVQLVSRTALSLADEARLEGWFREHEPKLRAALEHDVLTSDQRLALEVAGLGPDESVFQTLLQSIHARLAPDATAIVELLDEKTGTGRLAGLQEGGRSRAEMAGVSARVSVESVRACCEGPAHGEPRQGGFLDWSGASLEGLWEGLDPALLTSCTGLLVLDPGGSPIGCLVLLHREYAPECHLPVRVLESVCARIGAELARTRSEERRLSNERRLGQSLRLRSLALFAGGLSHELNNLMMAVRGNAEIALAWEGLAPEPRERLEGIRAASRSAAALTSQLLAFVGRSALDTHVTDLTLWLDRWIGLARSTAPAHVAIETSISEDRIPVALDSVGFFQALAEVLTNALEAIGVSSGRVHISSGVEWMDPDRVEGVASDVTGLQPRTYARVSVTNSGSSLVPADQARAFDPFFSTKEDARGMGLSVAAGILRDLNGCMAIQNAVDGVRVDLWVPVAEEEAQQADESDAGPLPGRVLLVEDEAPVRLAVRLLLEHLGIEVVEADGGPEALAVLEGADHDVELVIADLVMPRMDGLTFLELALERSPDLAMLLMSGFHDGSASPQLERMQPLEVLQKPFSIEDMDAALRRARAHRVSTTAR